MRSVAMEKLVYILWKPESAVAADWASELRSETADRLEAGGAQRLRVNVIDEHVAEGGAVSVGRMRPAKSGMISCWLEVSDDRAALDAEIARVTERFACYLVVESRPLTFDQSDTRRGDRTPGFNFVSCIVPKADMAYSDFLEHWYTTHRRAAIETQSTFTYVRNEIVRGLSPDAPEWVAVVEEAFPLAAMTDPGVFFASGGDAAVLEAHRKQMVASVLAFLDLSQVESHPMSEYIFAP